MRRLAVLAFALAFALPAAAQTPAAKQPAPKASPKASPKAAPKQKANPVAASYEAMPLNERIAIQSDLIWTGVYNGIANGEFGERAIAAVKAFQARNGTKQTGVLNPQERAALAAAAKRRSDAVGWQIVEDSTTGTRLGIPTKQVPQKTAIERGMRWHSARGEVQVETFRIVESGTTLPAVFEAQKKVAGRKVEYNVLRPDFFVMSGLQNLKKFYVRAQIRDNEVRGITILWDQAMDGIMEPVVVAMSNTFAAFPAGVAVAPPPRRKVEYASGVVVTPDGYIITDRTALEDCNVITVAGFGGAEIISEDKSIDVTLLRVYGATDLKAATLGTEGRKATDATLAGIADPSLQAGEAKISTVKVKLSGNGEIRDIAPAPQPGFTGGPALDPQGRVIGLTTLRTPLGASPATGGPPVVLVTVEAILALINGNGVTLPSGEAGLEAAKASVVRVICVRK